MTAMGYRAVDGREIQLVTPWSDGSGMIPPPVIPFYNEQGTRIEFVYSGDPSSRAVVGPVGTTEEPTP